MNVSLIAQVESQQVTQLPTVPAFLEFPLAYERLCAIIGRSKLRTSVEEKEALRPPLDVLSPHVNILILSEIF